MERVRGPFNVNSIAQHIGSLILNEDKFIEKSIKHNEKWKNILIRKFNDFDLYTEASYTNFLLVRVPKKFSKNKLLKNLKKNKILVRDLESYNLKNYFRVSIGTNSQMTRFLRVLEKILNKL